MEHGGHIVVDGTSNFRDLAWPLRADGAPAGPRRVFRSANLDRLSPEGRRRIAGLDIGVVIDLRGVAEAAAVPELDGTTRVHLPIEPTVLAELREHLAAGTLSVDAAVAVMESTYRRYVVDHAEALAGVLHRVLGAQERAVLIHCAAGKDRTGVAAALILMTVGVPPDAIMEDYLLSNRFFRPATAGAPDIPPEVREAIIKVRPSFLDAAVAAMIEGWGDPDGYLEKALGIGPRERAAMRAAIS